MAAHLIKALCVPGTGSLICLLTFLGMGVVYRKELDERREEHSRLAMKKFGVTYGCAQHQTRA